MPARCGPRRRGSPPERQLAQHAGQVAQKHALGAKQDQEGLEEGVLAFDEVFAGPEGLLQHLGAQAAGNLCARRV